MDKWLSGSNETRKDCTETIPDVVQVLEEIRDEMENGDLIASVTRGEGLAELSFAEEGEGLQDPNPTRKEKHLDTFGVKVRFECLKDQWTLEATARKFQKVGPKPQRVVADPVDEEWIRDRVKEAREYQW